MDFIYGYSRSILAGLLWQVFNKILLVLFGFFVKFIPVTCLPISFIQNKFRRFSPLGKRIKMEFSKYKAFQALKNEYLFINLLYSKCLKTKVD